MLVNFLRIRNPIPWRESIAYIDAKDNGLGDEIFTNSGVSFSYKKEAVSDQTPFSFIFISFPKKAIPTIMENLERIDRLMTFRFGQDYIDFKDFTNSLFKGALERE